ncbi:hypothetical protein BASA50_009878 [Batrachochytrium salamandrivorans]|uniref:Uncharacterized protein n=1 Tax=Batrachochytrium salamandrivorans TaxID=1357716 RepID=A0ABQ8F0I2_9FUNG|nr:hypothetical protein BASA50_009878 [Batrachochytrium salamandrivorans]
MANHILSRHRLAVLTSQLANFHKAIARWPVKLMMPIHAPQFRPTNAGPDLLRHLRLHRGAKYIHSPYPDRVLRLSSLSRDFLIAGTSPD